MKLLLDENVPKKVKQELLNHDVFTVHDMGWRGKQNGELLRLMISNGFQGLITADKNIQTQQNFATYPIPVYVLNVVLLTFYHIQPLLPSLQEKLASEADPGIHIINAPKD